MQVFLHFIGARLLGKLTIYIVNFLVLKISNISVNTLKRNLIGCTDLLSIYSFFTNWIHGKKINGITFTYIQFLHFTKEALSLKVSFPYCFSAYFLKINPILNERPIRNQHTLKVFVNFCPVLSEFLIWRVFDRET